MRGEFRSYNAAYADSLNEQMLLNLARLENGHPAYYLAIGAINNKFNLTTSATAGGTGNYTDNDTTTDAYQSSAGPLSLATRSIQSLVGRVLGYNVSGTVSRSSTPDFQFIPLNNEAVAKQVLEPIPANVFTTLFLQGYPIDHLMRVMIERIETTLPDGQEVVLINSPTRGPTDYFARFLRTCAILQELQTRGELLIETRPETDATPGSTELHSTSAPAEQNASPTDASKRAEGTANGGAASNRNNGPSRLEMFVPTFYLNSNHVGRSLAQFRGDAEYLKAVTNVVTLLANGVTIKTRVGNRGQANTRLVLRSFARAMEAVASEQAPFESLRKEGVLSEVPDAEMRPVLQMLWAKAKTLTPPLQTVRYAGKTYQISDEVKSPLDPAARWNRDVFRLMVVLSSQVTVDISKFQRQIFELRTD
ncbi:MAG: hypothetical protein U1G07_24025 [Verrucomicrobiota bacterium]